MAPVRRFTQMVGTCVFSIVYGLMHTAIILAVIAGFFQIDLAGANLLGGTPGPAGGQPLLHRRRHHGGGAAHALHRARLADDPRHPGRAAAHLRRLLPGGRAAGLDAAGGPALAGHLRAGGHAPEPAGRARAPASCWATSCRWWSSASSPSPWAWSSSAGASATPSAPARSSAAGEHARGAAADAGQMALHHCTHAIDTILRLQSPKALDKPPECDRIVPVQLEQFGRQVWTFNWIRTAACLSTPN